MQQLHPSDKTALIVGAGIAGLTAALALRGRGWRVQIFEQAPRLEEVGAGIQLSPNAMQVMQALGLAEALEAVGFRPQASEIRRGDSGKLLMHNAMQDYATHFGAPYLHIHRADVIATLQQKLAQDAAVDMHTHSPVHHFRDYGDGVVVQLADGRTEAGDLLLGADGLHSSIRAGLWGQEAPRFTGMMAWRVVVPMAALATPPPPTACVWVGRGKHAVTYRLRGGTLANLVGVVSRKTYRQEDWQATGTRQEALADFDDFHPLIQDMLGQCETLHRWALFDRPALPRWVAGRVALLGDACHPMLPFMAQGAAQAMEDAYVLAKMLAENDPIETALLAYEKARLPRTRRVQAVARANAKLFHGGAWMTRLFGYGPLSMAGKVLPDMATKRFAWLYGHNVTHV